MISDHSLAELAPETAYAVWRLRQQVFVLEQACLYPDLDGRDVEPGTRHVVLTSDDDGGVLGYLRVLDDGDVWRIGRVALDPAVRGRGLADGLMQHALTLTTDRDVVLDAQTPLAGWYASLGFVQDGEEFLEDDIPHTPMRLRRR
ncbi:GNAT family N-acetyltransferase [Nocardioides sp. Kera G14]|uniref:GNAT family N-acetyltransferase n=1 Tax=Nocardioides sp. Kera G14 TaxID=2884264 RepID=UPI001D120377|nr:GNAT family N-acetyltransferase [Nocardioides sp. Kera G14]UDY23594.1 GNAT family N-acetyltransferase [Nocardioides sp. Kera G14]